MRTLFATALLGTALVAGAAAGITQERPSDAVERGFVANGRITMDLSAGEYRITGTPDNRIRLTWSARDSEQLSKVRAHIDVRGSKAAIDTSGPTDQFKVKIEVPNKADLYVRLTAGELRLERVEGNKDVELHAGELHIDVDRADAYHSVDASVWAGEIHAAPFHVAKEGLFRSFDWKGHGPYRLHARLKAGEVWLSSRTGE